jgi:hypothetical protein
LTIGIRWSKLLEHAIQKTEISDEFKGKALWEIPQKILRKSEKSLDEENSV